MFDIDEVMKFIFSGVSSALSRRSASARHSSVRYCRGDMRPPCRSRDALQGIVQDRRPVNALGAGRGDDRALDRLDGPDDGAADRLGLDDLLGLLRRVAALSSLEED